MWVLADFAPLSIHKHPDFLGRKKLSINVEICSPLFLFTLQWSPAAWLKLINRYLFYKWVFWKSGMKQKYMKLAISFDVKSTCREIRTIQLIAEEEFKRYIEKIPSWIWGLQRKTITKILSNSCPLRELLLDISFSQPQLILPLNDSNILITS